LSWRDEGEAFHPRHARTKFKPAITKMNSPSTLRLIACRLLFFALAATAWAQSTYTTPYYFSTLAGVASLGSADGAGSEARFYSPAGMARDAAGNLYVTDTRNHTIRKITPGGIVTTYAGKPGVSGSGDGPANDARFNQPFGIAIDATGTLFVADSGNHTIRKITPAGAVTTLAGSADSYGNEDGTGSVARFYGPRGVALDPAGILYVTDTTNELIRKVTPSGIVTTLAGAALSDGSADGTGSTARFSAPTGIAADQAGNVYVVDTDNHTIRKITPAGAVTTLAGTAGAFGSADGTGGAARFFLPEGLTLDAAGNLYAGDWGYSTVRKITPSGVVTTVAGTTGSFGNPNYTGPIPANSGSVAPFGIAVDATGMLFVADSGNNTIHKITPTGTESVMAGRSPFDSIGTVDGTGSNARFSGKLGGVVAGPSGETYVADTGSHTVRKITAAGLVTTFAGAAGVSGSADGAGSAARFNGPQRLAADAAGNLYVSDTGSFTIRKITPAGLVSTFAGTAGSSGSTDGTGSAARFFYPTGIATDQTGNVYVADAGGIRKITPAGAVTTLGDSTGPYSNTGYGLAVDRTGNLYVALNFCINKISPAGAGSLLAGDITSDTGDLGFGIRGVDGTGSAARFYYPQGLAVDASGNVYVADTGNNKIRKITPAGMVTTLAGLADVVGNADGVGSEARFEYPTGIALDATGNVYVTELSTLRKGQLAGPPVISTQPLSQTVATGSNVQFSVIAGGAPAPAYQWYFNGSPFNGATTSTLSFSSARSADAGDYSVVVTNELGSVTSSKATLTVSAAPVTPPAPTPAPASGGGGSIEGWFVCALLVAGAARFLRGESAPTRFSQGVAGRLRSMRMDRVSP
jgi:sugar lactone lactonase YvrE